MDINRSNRRSLISCAPDSEPQLVPDPAVLWYHINSSDRYNSLILGLPVGSYDDNSADPATQSGEDFARWRELAKSGTQADRVLASEQTDILEGLERPEELGAYQYAVIYFVGLGMNLVASLSALEDRLSYDDSPAVASVYTERRNKPDQPRRARRSAKKLDCGNAHPADHKQVDVA